MTRSPSHHAMGPRLLPSLCRLEFRHRAGITGLAVGILLSVIPQLHEARAEGVPGKANVVIFMSDDMGWNDVGYHGGVAETPNLDRLSQEGMRLERFYAHPICSPTRTAMMTGRSPARFGITGPLGGDRGVPLDERFLSEAFQNAGYQTFAVGKWHLGAVGDDYAPQARGFDHFYGSRDGMIDYYEHTFKGRLDWQRNGEMLEETGYSTDLFATEAVSLIETRDPSKPVFLYLAFNAPHGPTQAPEALIQKYRDLGSRNRSESFHAAIDAMDQAIGRVLETLDREGMAENTLVLFFCDNGGKVSGEAASEDGGLALRGGKGSLLEGGVRVPAVLRWPGVIEAGARCEQLVSVTDLLPTLSAAVGIAPGNAKPLDGVNVWPALRDNEIIARPPLVIAGSRGEFAVLDDPFKLILGNEAPQLYDIRRDPTEATDLVETEPQELDRLKAHAEPFLEFGSTARGKGKEKGKGKNKGERAKAGKKQPR